MDAGTIHDFQVRNRAVAKNQCFLKPSTCERMGKGQASLTGRHRKCSSLKWMGGQLTWCWPRRDAVIITMLDHNKFVLYSRGRSYPNILDQTVWGVRAHVSTPRLLEKKLTRPVWLFKKRKEVKCQQERSAGKCDVSTHLRTSAPPPPPWWKKRTNFQKLSPDLRTQHLARCTACSHTHAVTINKIKV